MGRCAGRTTAKGGRLFDPVSKMEAIWTSLKSGQEPMEGILAKFRGVILGEVGIPDGQKEFYLHWAQSYLRFCRERSRPAGEFETRRDFLGELARFGRAAFVLKQAEKAVRILQRFVPKDVSRQVVHSGAGVSAADTAVRWDAARKRVEDEIRLRHFSRKTGKTYSHWVRTFAGFIDDKGPEEVDAGDVRAFLAYLAMERKIAASTQNQAFNALLFLFKHVLDKDLAGLGFTVRAKKPMDVPMVLSKQEVHLVFRFLSYPYDVFFKLLYGCGLRLGEGLGLRVQDLDVRMGTLTVYRGKGGKSRRVPLPRSLAPALDMHLARVKAVFEADESEGSAGVFLSETLQRKLPGACRVGRGSGCSRGRS